MEDKADIQSNALRPGKSTIQNRKSQTLLLLFWSKAPLRGGLVGYFALKEVRRKKARGGSSARKLQKFPFSFRNVLEPFPSLL
jgi:hypothetical protein